MSNCQRINMIKGGLFNFDINTKMLRKQTSKKNLQINHCKKRKPAVSHLNNVFNSGYFLDTYIVFSNTTKIKTMVRYSSCSVLLSSLHHSMKQSQFAFKHHKCLDLTLNTFLLHISSTFTVWLWNRHILFHMCIPHLQSPLVLFTYAKTISPLCWLAPRFNLCRVGR